MVEAVEVTTRVYRADVNGIRLYYRRAGTGVPVLLVHGFPEPAAFDFFGA